MSDDARHKVVSGLIDAAGRTEIALRQIRETYQGNQCLSFNRPAWHALKKTERAHNHLQTAIQKLVSIPTAKPQTTGPETFLKIGERFVAQREIQAAIQSGIETATQELLTKLAALDAPKKGKS